MGLYSDKTISQQALPRHSRRISWIEKALFLLEFMVHCCLLLKPGTWKKPMKTQKGWLRLESAFLRPILAYGTRRVPHSNSFLFIDIFSVPFFNIMSLFVILARYHSKILLEHGTEIFRVDKSRFYGDIEHRLTVLEQCRGAFHP